MMVPTTNVAWPQIYISHCIEYLIKFLCSYKVKAAYQRKFIVILAQYIQS